jgi:hypothetical protein
MMALLLSGCGTSFLATENKVVDTFCIQTKLILISKKDDLTDGTARQILAHNELVQKNCPNK